jgi:hypothetical protein
MIFYDVLIHNKWRFHKNSCNLEFLIKHWRYLLLVGFLLESGDLVTFW